ncbi:DnaJ domain-containing protein [bacterium]|nr:DnaJ domain-containing protein [bacterium]
MKDYYLLLGVKKDADKSEIKRAYRASVKQCHPDSGNLLADSQQFRDVTEAYETLYDSNKRQVYDQSQVKKHVASRCQRAEPVRRGGSQVGPAGDPDSFGNGSTDIRFGQWHHNGQFKKPVYYRVRLTPEENLHDVAYPCTIKILKPCSRCRHLFPGGLFLCPDCHGRQVVTADKELIINIPRGTVHGTCVQLDLERVGISGASLVVMVEIAAG